MLGFNDDLALPYSLFQPDPPEVTTARRHVLIVDKHFKTGRLQLAELHYTELWSEDHRSPMLTALLSDLGLLD